MQRFKHKICQRIKLLALAICSFCLLAALASLTSSPFLKAAYAKEEFHATRYQKAIINALVYEDLKVLNTAFDLEGTQLGQELAQTYKDIVPIKVSDLASDYRDNELQADTKYNDKWLMVTGTINAIYKAVTVPFIQIRGEVQPSFTVNVFFKDPIQALSYFNGLEDGQSVTLVCKGVDKSPTLSLQKCEFLDEVAKPFQAKFKDRLIDAVEGKGDLKANAIWAFTILRIEQLLGPNEANRCESSSEECLKIISHIRDRKVPTTVPELFYKLGYTKEMISSNGF